MTYEEQVLIRGKVFLYKQKAPFRPSGVSVHGALEYDEGTDQVRCHECGTWHCGLGMHVRLKHGMDSREYKIRHGLRIGSSLGGIRSRAKRSAASAERKNPAYTNESRSLGGARSAAKRAERKARGETVHHWERRNENGTCQAQILSRLGQLAERLGRTPRITEIEAAGIWADSACLAFNVKHIKDVLSLLGLPTLEKGVHGYKYSRQLLTELLRDFYVKHERLPGRRDWRLGLIPSAQHFQKYFGSMGAAYDAAGLASVAAGSPRHNGALVWRTKKSQVA